MPIVRDKGRIPRPTGELGHPRRRITLLDQEAQGPGEFDVEVTEARHLGEITLSTMALPAVSGARLLLTLSGPQRQQAAVGARLAVRLDVHRVHVMPLRPRPLP